LTDRYNSMGVAPDQNVAPRRSPLWVIARNTLFGMGAQFALRGLSFVFNIFVVRQLGDAGFGQYSIILAWTGIFSFIGDMGITQYMTREIARDRDKALSLFWDVTALRLILAILAILITVLGAVYMSYSRETVIAIALLSSTYFIQAFLTPLYGIIAGYERLDILSVLTVLGQIIFYATGTFFLLTQPEYIWLVVASLVNLPILTAIGVWIVVHKNMKPPPIRISPAIWMPLLRYGLPFAFIQVSLTFAFRFDTLILENYYSKDVVGWYNAAYTLTRSLLILTSAFSIALVPTMAREYVLEPKVIKAWYFRTVKFIALVGLPLAAGGMMLADKIILHLYGPDFILAILAFAILIWDTPLLMYTSLCGNFTTAMKIESRAAWVYGCEAVFNILLNLLLIPRHGILAASVITVATEFVGTVLFYRIFRREIGPGFGLSSAARIAISIVVMGMVVFLLRDLNIYILNAFAVFFYCFLIWATKTLTQEEQVLIKGSLQRFRGALLGRK